MAAAVRRTRRRARPRSSNQWRAVYGRWRTVRLVPLRQSGRAVVDAGRVHAGAALRRAAAQQQLATDRPSETRPQPRPGPGANRCDQCGESRALSATQAGADQRRLSHRHEVVSGGSGRRIEPDALFALGRRAVGAHHRLRERGEPRLGPGRRAGSRAGDPARARRQPPAPVAPDLHRDDPDGADRRHPRYPARPLGAHRGNGAGLRSVAARYRDRPRRAGDRLHAPADSRGRRPRRPVPGDRAAACQPRADRSRRGTRRDAVAADAPRPSRVSSPVRWRSRWCCSSARVCCSRAFSACWR